MNKGTVISFLFVLHSSTLMNEEKTYQSNEKKTLRKIASISHNTSTHQAKKQKRKSPFKKTRDIYIEMSKYPPNSYPIDHKKSGDFIFSKYLPQDEWIWSEQSDKFAMRVWPEKYIYYQDERFLKLIFETNEDVSLDITISEIRLTKQVNGKGIIEIPIDKLENEDHIIKVHAKSIATKAQLSSARVFTKKAKDFEFIQTTNDYISSKGDLIIKNKFDILSPGDYLLEGTLYNENNKIIAASETILNLEVGEQEVPLTYYGKIFHHTEHGGQLNLKYLSMSKINKDLSTNKQPLIESHYKTQKYDPAVFHDLDYNDEIIMDKLSKLK